MTSAKYPKRLRDLIAAVVQLRTAHEHDEAVIGRLKRIALEDADGHRCDDGHEVYNVADMAFARTSAAETLSRCKSCQNARDYRRHHCDSCKSPYTADDLARVRLIPDSEPHYCTSCTKQRK